MTSETIDSASGASGPALGNVDTILCLFCRASIHFVGLPAFRYADHLFKEHNILFDKEAVIDRTLQQQVQGYKSDFGDFAGNNSGNYNGTKKLMLEASVQVDFVDFNRPKSTIKKEPEPPHELPEEPPTSLKYGSEEANNRTEIVNIAWYSGCEYQCRICQKVYFYTEELRKHVQSHCKISDYLDKYSTFETRSVFYSCNICSQNIKRNFSAIRGHLQDEHPGTTFLSYEAMYKLTDYQVRIPKVVSTETASQSRNGLKRQFPESKLSEVQHVSKLEESKEEIPIKRTRHTPSASNNDSGDTEEKDLWYNGCEFECQVCSKTFFALNKLLFHTKTKHHLTAKPYQKKYRRFETRTLWYKCQMCQLSIKRQKSSVENHLKSLHEMKLTDYGNIFHPSTKKLVIKTKKCDAGQSRKTIPIQKYSFSEFKRGFCKFKCHICEDFNINEAVKFWRHSSDLHNLEKKIYKKMYGDPCSEIVNLECPICFKKIRFEFSSITKHAQGVHSQGFEQFYKSHFSPDFESGVMSPEENKDPINTEKSSLDVVDFFDKSNSAVREVIVRQWSDKCIYACGFCKETFPSNSVMCNHLRVRHTETAASHKEKFGPLLSESVFHTCLICEKQVMHQHIAIKSHLEMHGNKSIDEYFVQYVAPTLNALPKDLSFEISEKIEGEEVVTENQESAGEPSITSQQFQSDSFVEWCEQCEFKCLECHELFLSYNKLRSHMIGHNLTPVEYKKKFSVDSFMTRGVKHTCVICQKTFSHTKMLLSRHFREHNMDVYTYYIRNIAKNQPSTGVAPKMVPDYKPTTPLISNMARYRVETESFPKSSGDLSRWANRCRYDCQICYAEHNTSMKLKCHVTAKHAMSFLAYKIQFTNLASKVVIHRCRICQAKIYWSAKCLGTHLKSTHAMTLEEYYQDRFSVVPPKEQHDATRVTLSSPSQISHSKTSASNQIQDVASSSPLTVPSSTSDFVRWKNQCNYDCQLCGQEYKDYAQLKPHILKTHMVSINEYRAQFGRCITKSVKHVCKICQRPIQHTHDSLAHHSREAHNISCTEYYETYISFGVTDTDGKHFTFADENPTLMLQPDIQYAPKFFPESRLPDDLITSPSAEQSQFAAFKPQNSFTKWKNQCRYDCQICEEPYHDYKAFRNHIQTFHQVSVDGYKHTYGHTMTRALNHPCQICGKEIRHNENNLNQHISSTHKLSLSQYYQAYIAGNENPITSIESQPNQTSTSITDISADLPSISSKNGSLEQTPIQQWRNQCTFFCKICSYSTGMKQDFERHLKRIHAIDRHQYGASHGDPMTERVYTNCLICELQMLHEYNVIRCHLREKHAMSISYYFETYIKRMVSRDLHALKDYNDESSNDTILTDTSVTGVEPDAWMNESIFQCRMCDSHFKSKLRFNDHVAKDHNMVYDDYEAMHGDPTTMTMNSFTCKICGEMTFHNDEQITDHMGLKHGILPSTYYSEFIANSNAVDEDGAPTS